MRLPIRVSLLDCDNARLLVMHIVSCELMQCQSYRRIYLIICFSHTIYSICIYPPRKHNSTVADKDFKLHRNISVLLSWQVVTLSSKLCQTATDAETSVARLNHIINVAILGCLIWISEHLGVFLFLLSKECLRILMSLCLLGTKHRNGTACTHNSNLC